jgi:NhaP-type Na+/H+ and K+/H+ antiporter
MMSGVQEAAKHAIKAMSPLKSCEVEKPQPNRNMLQAVHRLPAHVATFGVFQFAGHVPVGRIADFYGLPVPQAEKAAPVGDFIADRLPAKPAVGDSIGIGMIGLVVHDVNGERVTRVGLEL